MVELRHAADQISRRVREREIRRQLLANRIRKAVLTRVPPLLGELLTMTVASLIGYWLLAYGLSFAGVASLYTLVGFAALYAAQATYYKVRLAVDPGFRIPSCNCSRARFDDSASVLGSPYSSIAGVPTSVLALPAYAGILVVWRLGHDAAAIGLAAALVLAGIVLGYVMVARIASLCTTCVNIAALNVLILLELVR